MNVIGKRMNFRCKTGQSGWVLGLYGILFFVTVEGLAVEGVALERQRQSKREDQFKRTISSQGRGPSSDAAPPSSPVIPPKSISLSPTRNIVNILGISMDPFLGPLQKHLESKKRRSVRASGSAGGPPQSSGPSSEDPLSQGGARPRDFSVPSAGPPDYSGPGLVRTEHRLFYLPNPAQYDRSYLEGLFFNSDTLQTSEIYKVIASDTNDRTYEIAIFKGIVSHRVYTIQFSTKEAHDVFEWLLENRNFRVYFVYDGPSNPLSGLETEPFFSTHQRRVLPAAGIYVYMVDQEEDRIINMEGVYRLE